MAATHVFICAARQDQDLCEELITHLAPLEYQGLIKVVQDQALSLGQSAQDQRLQRVREARVFLLLLSPSLLRGLAENDVVREALERHVRDELVLVPVVLRACDWEAYSFGKLVSLPRDGKPITDSSPRARDAVWLSIVRELRQLITELPKDVPRPPPARENPVDSFPGTGPGSDEPPRAPSGGVAKAPSSAGSGRFRQGHALIIGTGQPGIEVTAGDAQAVHGLLTNPNRAGYPATQARLLTNQAATRSAILRELAGLVARVNADPDRDATVFVYFSGHGLRVGTSNPSYYLIPWDYSVGNEATTAISGKEFSDLIGQIKSRKLMVFLDCCHAAGVPKTAGVTITTAAFPRDLERQLGHGSGLVIVASSRDNEVSWTSTPYSLFTTCLLEALDGKGSSDGYARVLNVLAYLMQEVPKRQPNQHPVVRKMLDLDDNFAICFHDAASQPDQAAAPRGARKTMPNSEPSSTIDERYLASLNEAADLHVSKIARLRRALAISADPMQQFAYEQQIVDEEKNLAALQEKIAAYRSRPASSSAAPKAVVVEPPAPAARPVAAGGRVPTRPSLRRTLQGAIPTSADLDAFCLDYFERIYRRFGSGMDREAKLSMLLQLADRRQILDCLRKDYPDFDYDSVLEFE